MAFVLIQPLSILKGIDHPKIITIMSFCYKHVWVSLFCWKMFWRTKQLTLASDFHIIPKYHLLSSTEETPTVLECEVEWKIFFFFFWKTVPLNPAKLQVLNAQSYIILLHSGNAQFIPGNFVYRKKVCGIIFVYNLKPLWMYNLLLLGLLHRFYLLEKRLTFISTIFVPYRPSYRHTSLKQTLYLDLTTGNIVILVKARKWYNTCVWESKYICSESPSAGHCLNCVSFAENHILCFASILFHWYHCWWLGSSICVSINNKYN